jgi:hypothetical protein
MGSSHYADLLGNDEYMRLKQLFRKEIRKPHTEVVVICLFVNPFETQYHRLTCPRNLSPIDIEDFHLTRREIPSSIMFNLSKVRFV